jgi:hypothetical protein
VGILNRLSRLDDKLGMQGIGPRAGESRRDFLERLARSRMMAYVPRSVYVELVELHDRVAALEATVAQLEADR